MNSFVREKKKIRFNVNVDTFNVLWSRGKKEYVNNRFNFPVKRSNKSFA